MFSRSRQNCIFAELQRRHALTLMELLVVLVILAIVATIAVQSLQPRVESARFDQTRKTLDEVQLATCGDPRARQADGSPLLSGFVSDIGRTPSPSANQLPSPEGNREAPVGPTQPQLLTQKIPTPSLHELWSDQCFLAREFPFQFRPGPKTPIDCSDIQLPCGWRGPYLQLPVGQTELTDAWARPFETQLDEEQNLAKLTWTPVGDFEQNISADLTSAYVTVSGTIQFGETSAAQVQSVMLVPDPTYSTTELRALIDLDPSPQSFLFERVPIGLRAIRIVADGKTITKYIEVPHGGLTLLIDAERQSGGKP